MSYAILVMFHKIFDQCVYILYDHIFHTVSIVPPAVQQQKILAFILKNWPFQIFIFKEQFDYGIACLITKKLIMLTVKNLQSNQIKDIRMALNPCIPKLKQKTRQSLVKIMALLVMHTSGRREHQWGESTMLYFTLQCSCVKSRFSGRQL